jgi:hypothetical protein
MIPTNKFEPKYLRIEGTSCAQKNDENSSKKTRKSNDPQAGNRHGFGVGSVEALGRITLPISFGLGNFARM